ncbi:MAG: hypothetical protein E3J54_02090, partial [Actinobacteria bacterium]
MNILGINCFSHDTSAALLKDGTLLAFAEEERFNREKHTRQFPHQAIEFCLKKGSLSINDVEYVAFPFIPIKDLQRGFTDFIRNPRSFLRFAGQINFDYQLNKKMRKFKNKYNFENHIVFVGHHEAHSAASFYCSPFKEAALLSIDRGGDYISTFLGVGKGNEITTVREIKNPHSLGSFYSSITNFLGFKPNGGEGKVMGLAPYGKPTFYNDFKKMIKLEENGFKIDLRYFTYHLKGGYGVSKRFKKKFGLARLPDSDITRWDEDIAWSLQKVTEDVAIHLANYLYKKTKLDYLCLSGGLALNGVMNHAIRKNTPFKDIFIQPAANDGGTSIGAAHYVRHVLLKKPRKESFDHCYLGPACDDADIKKSFEGRNLKRSELANPAKKVAELLKERKIIGWFQGGMEGGPSTLGNRSILGDARSKDTQTVMNLK